MNQEKLKKITKEYDAITLMMPTNMGTRVLDLASKALYLENKAILQKLDTQIVKQERFTNLESSKKTLVNSIRAKEAFDILEKQNKYQKLNIVFENPYRSYENLLVDIEQGVESLKEMLKYIDRVSKGTDSEEEKASTSLPISVTALLESTDFYKERFANYQLMVEKEQEMVEQEKLANATLLDTFKHLKKNKRYEDFLMENMHIGFVRFEIDFEKENVKVYECYTKITGFKSGYFEPWNHDLKEKMVLEYSFKNVKQNLITQEENEIQNYIQNIEETIDNKIKGDFFAKATNIPVDGENCPIGQFSYEGFDSLLSEYKDRIFYLIAYVIKNDLLKENKNEKTVTKIMKVKKKSRPVNKKVVMKNLECDEEKMLTLNEFYDEKLEKDFIIKEKVC